MVLSKIAEYPIVGQFICAIAISHERQIFTAASFDLPGTENAPAVRVEQDRNNQSGMISILAFKLIAAFNYRGIKLLKKIRIEIAFVIFRISMPGFLNQLF